MSNRNRAMIVCICVFASTLQACALTAGVLQVGQAPSKGSTSLDCAADETVAGGRFIRASTIGGDLLARRETGGLAGVPGGWIRLRAPVSARARSNEVFIADVSLRQIIAFDLDTQRARVFADLPTISPRTRLFVDRALSIYVADPAVGEVIQFDLDGRRVQTFRPPPEQRNPVAVLVDDVRGEVFVADGLTARVAVFNSFGGLVRSIGDPSIVSGVQAIAHAGDQLYMVDASEARVAALGLSGKFRYHFGEELVAPRAIATDNENRVFVSDADSATISVFRGGEKIDVIGDPASGLAFRSIDDLWVNDNALFVADAERGTVDVLELARPCT